MRLFFRRIIIFLVFFIGGSAIISEEKENFFNFSASSGLIVGSGFEYVLEYDVTKSRLVWPLLPAGSFTAFSEFKLKKGFHFSFFSSFTFPSYSGHMFDYDYLNSYSPSMLTKFSEHKAYIKTGLDLSLTLGWRNPLIQYRIPPDKTIKISCEPSLGIRYILNSWDAVDGYTKYPPLTNPPSPVLPETPIVPMNGVGISYKQIFILPSIGIGFNFELPKDWKIYLSTQIGPNAIGFSEDLHYLRENGGLKFVDVFKKRNISFYLYLSAEKKLSKYFSFFSSVDYTSITAYNGKSFVYSLKSGLLNKVSPTGAAGAALYYARINLGITLHILK